MCIPQNQMPPKYIRNNNKSAHEITTSSITKLVKTKRLRVQWFGEKIGMLLCRPYVDLNSQLTTRNRHLHHKDKCTHCQRFVEKIGMLICRPYVVNINSPLDTLHYLRWKISVVISSTLTISPPARQTTNNSSQGW